MSEENPFTIMDKKEKLFKIYNRKWNKLICDEINKESYANGHYSL